LYHENTVIAIKTDPVVQAIIKAIEHKSLIIHLYSAWIYSIKMFIRKFELSFLKVVEVEFFLSVSYIYLQIKI